jgi:hypothetical protein
VCDTVYAYGHVDIHTYGLWHGSVYVPIGKHSFREQVVLLYVSYMHITQPLQYLTFIQTRTKYVYT